MAGLGRALDASFVVVSCAVVASCSAAHARRAPVTPTAVPRSSSATRADPVALARAVGGCVLPRAAPVVGVSADPPAAASCRLDGALVIIDRWTSPGDHAHSIAALAPVETWYAYGPDWVAFLGDKGQSTSTTTLQMLITDDRAGLSEERSNGVPLTVPLSVQRKSAEQIAHALGGRVGHTVGPGAQ
jgi:hypothetical protein